ncbi:MAG: hypothetical protein L6V95_02510 [Candidatus Melainabacteria bacterium]|nr:MAG: hypothetical protein L6V95_02510 [Candidatus Melainabacteria bacterium]
MSNNNKQNYNLDDLITFLYQNVTTYRGATTVRDTTKLRNSKFDCYIDSQMTNPLSFTLFELSDKGELQIDNLQRLIESEAGFLLFVNPKTGWIFAIKKYYSKQEKNLCKVKKSKILK